MRIAYLDCFSGVSGDMFVGALVDAGVSPKLLEDTVKALDIGGRLEISKVVRAGISAAKVDVYANGEKDLPREVFLEQHGHDHPHEHSHGHEHSREHRPEHGRGLNEIRRIIEEGHSLATKVLRDHIDDLHRISQILIERETIDKDQFQRLLAGEPEQDVFVEEAPAPVIEKPAERKKRQLPQPKPFPLPGATMQPPEPEAS